MLKYLGTKPPSDRQGIVLIYGYTLGALCFVALIMLPSGLYLPLRPPPLPHLTHHPLCLLHESGTSHGLHVLWLANVHSVWSGRCQLYLSTGLTS